MNIECKNETDKLIVRNQEELEKILSENNSSIYLCGVSFNIPKEIKNKIFVGIGDSPVPITVYSEELDFFWSQCNEFKNIKYDDLYLKRKALLTEANNANNSSKLECYEKLANTGNIDGIIGIGRCYEESTGVKKNFQEAKKYYQQASDLRSARAMCYLAMLYEFYLNSIDEAIEWYQKSADLGYPLAQKKIKDIKKWKMKRVQL